MKIVIIEDEQLTADDLAESIVRLVSGTQIVAKLHSIKEAVRWFEKNKQPDLIFSDIQLGDGLSFEIFKKVSVSTPIIFCTAYDEYALNAFQTNGIDYILKPFDDEDILRSFEKYKNLEQTFSGTASVSFENVLQLLNNRNTSTKTSVLVYQRDKILPIRLDSIALFYIENEITYLLTFDQQSYTINKPLEELEKSTGVDFYRATRQHLVNRKAVKEISQYFERKLSIALTIPYKGQILVNKTKVTHFLNWLSAN